MIPRDDRMLGAVGLPDQFFRIRRCLVLAFTPESALSEPDKHALAYSPVQIAPVRRPCNYRRFAVDLLDLQVVPIGVNRLPPGAILHSDDMAIVKPIRLMLDRLMRDRVCVNQVLTEERQTI